MTSTHVEGHQKNGLDYQNPYRSIIPTIFHCIRLIAKKTALKGSQHEIHCIQALSKYSNHPRILKCEETTLKEHTPAHSFVKHFYMQYVKSKL